MQEGFETLLALAVTNQRVVIERDAAGDGQRGKIRPAEADQLADDGQDWLADHGYDVEFGARPLRRLIQSEVEDKLSDGILSGKFTLGSIVRITVDKEGNLTLVNDDESYSDEGEIFVAPTGTPAI